MCWLIFSGNQDPKLLAECYAKGANSVVIKPHLSQEYDDVTKAIINFWGYHNSFPNK